MVQRMRGAILLLGAALLLTVPMAADAQNKEKVYRNIAPAQVESILTELGIQYNKTQPAKAPKDYDYDFQRNNYSMRLTLSNGKLLWLSSHFPTTQLEKINQWNINAKFSRAVVARVGDREYAFVESQIDAGGGITDTMLRQFIRRFDGEVRGFDNLLRQN